MFWKRSINKIFFTTLIVFIAFVLFSFSKTSVDKESYSNSSYKVSLYTINDDSYVSMTSVFLDGDTLEEKVSNVIDIMIIDNNKNSLLPSYFKPILPRDTKLVSVKLDGDILKVVFSKELLNISSEQSDAMIESLLYTLLGFDEVVGVEIYVEDSLLKYVPNTNKKLPTVLYDDYGINKSYSLSSNMDIKRVNLYYYTKNNDDYYLIPVTKYVNDKREKLEIIVEELSSFLYHDNLISMLSDSVKLVSYDIDDDVISLDFTDSFDSLDNVSDTVVKPLLCSLFSNYSVSKVKISVDGVKILEKDKKDIDIY